jgi:inosine-uridine nucleoside N-ribohydrolase
MIMGLMCSTGDAKPKKTRIILDTDANNELDDQHAIAYMLFNGNDFDVEGITVNKTRNGGDVSQHYKEAERVVKLCALDRKIPIYTGANGSFNEIKDHVTKSRFDGMDAVDFIIKRAKAKSRRRLVLLPVGKLTNIALALHKDPSIASKVRIVWLGSNYPEPGEYNQDNDIDAMNYILDTNVEFEIALVRYHKPSGTDAVRASLVEIKEIMPGLGPRISSPVVGRHGNKFSNFGDYSVDLFKNMRDESRALFDMAAVAIVKDSSWAEASSIPCPKYANGKWIQRPENPRKITLWENFDKEEIMKDFYNSIENYVLAEHSGSRNRPRIVVTTDGEIDDRCSMVRFLLYANEWDIEGIIYCSSKFHWKGHKWAGEEWIERDIDLYARFYDTLKQHARGYPTPKELKSVTYIGNIDNVGEMKKETQGSNHIVKVLLDNEPGPLYLQAWGGTNTIARALKTIKDKHADQIEKVTKKAIIYIILDQDKTFRQYIQPNWPDLMVLGSFRQFATVAYDWQKIIPKDMHKYYDGEWMKKNILQKHGPLCARYESHKDGRFRSEGDSPAFMHQIVVGLGSLEHPTYGGWGGRFVREKNTKNVWRGGKDDGSWSKPIWRWSEDYQNDWAARADWCVKSFGEANHNPNVVVNGIPGKDIVRIEAKPGVYVNLSAAGSSDPDGDRLSFRWWYYKEPSTYPNEVKVKNANAEEAGFVVPNDGKGRDFHVILTVRDGGNPNLFAYRRVIVRGS